ncbi:hypothetical protein BaRGS_00033296 [Batillaria attramentaria]|uniref:Uncharacterized protein n=1 Tax=Batillaria attramentaria TaxID=370345 RepID=A0ABD0JKC6_9CAEN
MDRGIHHPEDKSGERGLIPRSPPVGRSRSGQHPPPSGSYAQALTRKACRSVAVGTDDPPTERPRVSEAASLPASSARPQFAMRANISFSDGSVPAGLSTRTSEEPVIIDCSQEKTPPAVGAKPDAGSPGTSSSARGAGQGTQSQRQPLPPPPPPKPPDGKPPAATKQKKKLRGPRSVREKKGDADTPLSNRFDVLAPPDVEMDVDPSASVLPASGGSTQSTPAASPAKN